MATETPPLLEHVQELAAVSPVPLLVSQAFRRGSEIEQALQAGADMVGVARPLIADPEFPSKILHGREREVRPCTSCNEDCRAKDPVLLCSVNPDLGPPGRPGRPAEPLVVRTSPPRPLPRVAVVGAGPAGLEAALRLCRSVAVEVFEAESRIGGQLLTAGSAPHRGGWLRLLDYYRRMLDGVPIHLGHRVDPEDLADFDEVIVAIGAQERCHPGATASSNALRHGVDGLSGVRSVLVADDGSNGWPTVSAVELAVAADCQVVVVTPANGFATAIPAESRAQLVKRLRGAEVEIRPLTSLRALGSGVAAVRSVLSGVDRQVEADRTIVVGERVARPWLHFQSCPAHVQVVGDGLVPRKLAHALAEGRAAAAAVVNRPPGQQKGSRNVGLVT